LLNKIIIISFILKNKHFFLFYTWEYNKETLFHPKLHPKLKICYNLHTKIIVTISLLHMY
jgi:hypothetical protein